MHMRCKHRYTLHILYIILQLYKKYTLIHNIQSKQTKHTTQKITPFTHTVQQNIITIHYTLYTIHTIYMHCTQFKQSIHTLHKVFLNILYTTRKIHIVSAHNKHTTLYTLDTIYTKYIPCLHYTSAHTLHIHTEKNSTIHSTQNTYRTNTKHTS